ncbi:hypothetical protein GCM10023205_25470 [Yinghuangia aomiensis]|uniref:Uncharacterized protein n=1 Tax=Yinghuangia aomiensis TaxID=676205 RepID=A0ABP9H450_9ACTN
MDPAGIRRGPYKDGSNRSPRAGVADHLASDSWIALPRVHRPPRRLHHTGADPRPKRHASAAVGAAVRGLPVPALPPEPPPALGDPRVNEERPSTAFAELASAVVYDDQARSLIIEAVNRPT